jgi:hypothetical protein
MGKNQLNGKVFEEVVKYFLKRQGYFVVPDHMKGYYGIVKKGNGLNLKGRGCEHQIDALGQFEFQIPFVYPIRLISEAKYKENIKKDKIGTPVIKNFVGCLKDISEFYSGDDYADLNKGRFTDCGVIFSTSSFTEGAQKYAYAQGVYLMQVPFIKDLIKEICIKIKNNNGDLSNIDQLIETSGVHKKYYYFGLASGLYPIAIASDGELPVNLFERKDEQQAQITYTYWEDEERGNNHQNKKEVLYFTIKLNNWNGYFYMPRHIWEKNMRLPDFKEKVMNIKSKVLNYIDIPISLSNGDAKIRRILRLTLDKAWLSAMRNG